MKSQIATLFFTVVGSLLVLRKEKLLYHEREDVINICPTSAKADGGTACACRHRPPPSITGSCQNPQNTMLGPLSTSAASVAV